MHKLYRPKVYVASKVRHAKMWRELRTLWSPYVELTSRWIDATDGQDFLEKSSTAEEIRRGWIADLQDVQRSDTLLFFQQYDDDALRGSYIEAGAALGLGKLVVAVGVFPSDTWSWHPLVRVESTLNAAFRFISYPHEVPSAH